LLRNPRSRSSGILGHLRAEYSPPEVCPTARDTGTGSGTRDREALTVQRNRLLLAAQREGIARDVIDCLDDADLEGVEYWNETQLRTAVRWYRDDPPALWRRHVRPVSTTAGPTAPHEGAAP
jgi:hypothetical protein